MERLRVQEFGSALPMMLKDGERRQIPQGLKMALGEGGAGD